MLIKYSGRVNVLRQPGRDARPLHLPIALSSQKRFIYRLLARHDFLPVWLVADK